MKLFKTLSCALAALAITAGASAQTDAPTPAQVAQACIEHMAQATGATVGAIQSRTQEGVHQLHYLAAHGAPAPVLIASARLSRFKINRAASTGARVVNHLAHACQALLTQLDAPDEMKEAVHNARLHALEAIGSARVHGVSIIGAALDAVLSDSGAVGLF